MKDRTEERGFRVSVEPRGITLFAGRGQTLFDSLLSSGIAPRSDCGGKGRCGKCRVLAFPSENLSPPSELESRLLSEEEIARDVRLACQVRVLGPITVEIQESSDEDGLIEGKTQVDARLPLDPAVERMALTLPDPGHMGAEPGRDLWGRIRERLRSLMDETPELDSLHPLRDLSTLEDNRGGLTLVVHKRRGITAAFPGFHHRSLGIAVDLGTTTLALYICDLKTGTILTSEGTINPQRAHGEDVISRISFCCERPDGLDILRHRIIGALNGLLHRGLRKIDALPQDVDEITVVGNTTMQQIFAGIHPRGLGFAPYLPVTCESIETNASQLGLDLHPSTPVYIFPVVSGFVGGDTLGAVLSEGPHRNGEITLLVDLGTNGELVLGNREGLWATSCATGPALEGAHLSCGMRAATGAIHRVSIHEDLSVDYEVIGGGDPQGICGSGVIDAVAEMLRRGILLPTGRLREGLPGVEVDPEGVGRTFRLVPAEKTGMGRQIALTLQDIRQIQLAKGALAVGIRLLMKRAEIHRIDRMVLTGSFGARFNWRNAAAIGMLPGAPLVTRTQTVDNAAGRGAIRALLDAKARGEIENLAPKIRVVELAQDPDFVREFPLAMGFPEPSS